MYLAMSVSSIEIESLSICLSEARKRLGDVDPRILYVASRCIHAVGDPSIVDSLRVCRELLDELEHLLTRLRLVVVDVEMVRAGIESRCRALGVPVITAVRFSTSQNLRVASGIENLIRRGVVDDRTGIVCGNAPTFLEVVVRSIEEGVKPLLVVATPPGFVKAAEVKKKLMELDVPYIVIEGCRGGSTLAVAIFNALIDLYTGRAFEVLKSLGLHP